MPIPSSKIPHPPLLVSRRGVLANNANPVARSPLIVTCPHAGRNFPDQGAFQKRLLVDLVELDRRGDTYTDWLSIAASEAGAHHIICTTAPAFINVGRSLGSVHSDHVRGSLTTLRPDPNDIYAEKGQGLVSTTNFTGGNIYQDGQLPDEREILDRVSQFYTPFHDFVDQYARATLQKHGYVLVFDVHSCPTFATTLEPDVTGTRRPDIILSNNGGGSKASCKNELIGMAAGFAATHGYSVGLNIPYKGGFLTQKFGAHNNSDKKGSMESLQIEFARGSYGLNQETLEIEDPRAFEKAQKFCTGLIRILSDYATGQAQVITKSLG